LSFLLSPPTLTFILFCNFLDTKLKYLANVSWHKVIHEAMKDEKEWVIIADEEAKRNDTGGPSNMPRKSGRKGRSKKTQQQASR
jgi:hypothetical protein